MLCDWQLHASQAPSPVSSLQPGVRGPLPGGACAGGASQAARGQRPPR